MDKRAKGERGGSYFGEIDLVLLKELVTSRRKYDVEELREKLGLAHMSTRRHLTWLIEIGLVFRDKVPGKNKAILTITNDGRIVLALFERLLKKAKISPS